MSNLRTRSAAILLLACAAAGPAQTASAQTVPAAPIRIWGDAAMTSVVLAWEQRFTALHPNAIFDNHLISTDSAMGALYGGIADIALLGRDSNTVEDDSFLHSLQYRPLQLHLMSGSLDTPGKTPAPVVFVARDNPLTRLTLAQLDQVVGCGQPGMHPARTWADLGLTGAFAAHPIHLYTIDLVSSTGLFLEHALQGESRKMNWPIITEFSDIERRDGSLLDASQQALDALARDPYGIAIATLRFATPATKPLPLATTAAGPFVAATPATLVDATYPLARLTYAFLNQPPGKALPPAAKEFMRFVLSPEGQQIVAAQQGFLPLALTDAAAQRAALNAADYSTHDPGPKLRSR